MADPFERPPIASAPLSVVLAARNAAGTLSEVLTAWQSYLDGLQRDYEILLIDDGSTDSTVEVLAGLAPTMPRLKVLRHAIPQGIGAALRTGIAAASQPLLCYCTADRQYQPGELQRMLEVIDPLDLVTGYRQWRPVPRWFRILETAYRLFLRIVLGIPTEPRPCWLGREGYGRRWLARWVFGIPLYDPECAFRLFRREVFDRIPIQSDGPFVHIEVLAKANFLGALLSQVPVSYQPPADGIAAFGLEKVAPHEIMAVLSDPEFRPPAEKPIVEAVTQASPPLEPGPTSASESENPVEQPAPPARNET